MHDRGRQLNEFPASDETRRNVHNVRDELIIPKDKSTIELLTCTNN